MNDLFESSVNVQIHTRFQLNSLALMMFGCIFGIFVNCHKF